MEDIADCVEPICNHIRLHLRFCNQLKVLSFGQITLWPIYMALGNWHDEYHQTCFVW